MEEETPPGLPINKLINKFGEKVRESMDVDLYNANCMCL
jgi:hypothetical protein